MKPIEEALEFMKRYENTYCTSVTKERIDALKIEKKTESFYNDKLPRVLMLGRFKSGKSSLINYLIGRKMAAVDVLEKTSWIARYWPCDEEFCVITRKDNTTIQMSVDEFVEKTEKNGFSDKELAEIYRIDVGYKSNSISVAFIDTPGIGANEENEKRTIDSLKDADLVINVIDVNKLGNRRESSFVAEIRASHIPMICVASKYDGDILLMKTVDEIKHSFHAYSSFDENDLIFPVSVANCEKSGKADDNMNRLIDYLSHIDMTNETRRQNAYNSRIMRIDNTCISVLRKLHTELNDIAHLERKFERKYELAGNRIHRDMERFIRGYVKENLYSEYKPKMVSALKSIIDQGMEENGQTWLESILPADYMDDFWDRMKQAVSDKMNELWSEEIEESDMLDSIVEIPGFDNTKNKNMSINGILAPLSKLAHTKEMNRYGMKISFASGGIAAFYEAVLGVNAAAVILPAAVVSVGIPVALMGAVITHYLVGKTRRNAASEMNPEMIIEDHIEDFSRQVIEICMGNLSSYEETIKNEVLKEYEKKCEREFIPEGSDIKNESLVIERIIEKLEKEINDLVFVYEGNDHIDAELIRLKTEIEDSKKKIDEAREENTRIEENLKQAQDKISGYKSERVMMRKKILELKSQVESDQSDICAKENELNQLKSELEKKKKESDGVTDKVKELTDRIKAKDSELKNLMSEKDDVQKHINELEIKQKTVEKSIEELKNEKEDLARNLEDSENHIRILEEENEKLKLSKEQAFSILSGEGSYSDFFRIKNELIDKVKGLEEPGNKWVLQSPDSRLTDLIFLGEGAMDQFLKDMEVILKQGSQTDLKHAQCWKELGNNRVLLTRENRYRIYFKKTDQGIDIKYIETYMTNSERYREFSHTLIMTYPLVNEFVPYKIFDMLLNAQKEVIIRVPAIEKRILENIRDGKRFIDIFKSLIARGVKIRIYTGNTSKHWKEETEISKRYLREEISGYGDDLIVYDCNPHDKILIVDGTCALNGSFNYLTNKGSFDPEQSSENMTVYENPLQVAEQMMIATEMD